MKLKFEIQTEPYIDFIPLNRIRGIDAEIAYRMKSKYFNQVNPQNREFRAKIDAKIEAYRKACEQYNGESRAIEILEDQGKADFNIAIYANNLLRGAMKA
jgi:uncharacterized membrane protein YkoI